MEGDGHLCHDIRGILSKTTNIYRCNDAIRAFNRSKAIRKLVKEDETNMPGQLAITIRLPETQTY